MEVGVGGGGSIFLSDFLISSHGTICHELSRLPGSAQWSLWAGGWGWGGLWGWVGYFQEERILALKEIGRGRWLLVLWQLEDHKARV